MPDQRQPGLRLWIDGKPVERVGDFVLQAEVEERSDEASSFQLTVAMNPVGTDSGGDWDVLEHGAFAEANGVPDFSLLRRITIELSLVADDGAEVRAVVMDGYITCVEPIFSEERLPGSRLVVYGLDCSSLMHFETVTREWHGMNDADIARTIFRKYGFAVTDRSIEATAPVRDLDRSTMVQRCTDAEFLRMLARRNGFEIYLDPAQSEIRQGPHPGEAVVGHFRSPRPDEDVQPPLDLFPRIAPSLIEFRTKWESNLPPRIRGWHIDEITRKIQRADVTEPDYLRMGTSSRAQLLETRLREIFRNGTKPEPVDIQTAEVPHDGAEVKTLARAEYRMADWFVNGSGIVLCERYPVIMRSRRPVDVTGAGHLLDGRWYCRAVRHRWAVNIDRPDEEPVTRRYEADVTLVRNALGGIG
jgi:hypothetical protein